jgi:hypothetical protein
MNCGGDGITHYHEVYLADNCEPRTGRISMVNAKRLDDWKGSVMIQCRKRDCPRLAFFGVQS